MASTALLDRLPQDRTPLLLGMRVRLRRLALDRALADGERAEASPLLALREPGTLARLAGRAAYAL